MGVTLSILFVGLWSIEGKPIFLPFNDGKISIGIDGQSANLRIDSGSARFFVIYGPEYEKGNRSCKDIKVCYFCPPENPCDDILERKNWTVGYGDGDVYTYVEHTVALNIGGIIIPKVNIGLAIDFYNIHGQSSPAYGILGLSYGRMDIPDTFLEQLRMQNVISSLSYRIHTDGDVPNFNGEIVFDDPSVLDDSFKHIKGVKNMVAVHLWPMQLMNAKGRRLARPYEGGKVKKDKPSPAVLDTGATDIYLTSSEFDIFIRSGGIVRFDDDLKFYVVDEKRVNQLPTFVFREENSPTKIKIEPKHYIQACENGICVVGVSPSCFDTAVLGHPFFFAYDVGVDISNEEAVIYIRNNTNVSKRTPTTPRLRTYLKRIKKAICC